MAHSPASPYQNPASNAERQQRLTVKPSRPLLRVMGNNGGEYYWLHKGKQGSLQTAAQMARLVREDTVRDEGLQRFAAQLLINSGLNSHSPKRDIIAVIFRYVKQISYIHDPAGSFDSIQSARMTIQKGFGDCDDLSVLLATLLAQVGFQPRFVLARYKDDGKGYDHVYVDVELPAAEGGRLPLDPSATRRGPGWESLKSIERLTYPIFAGPVSNLGDAMQLALTGAAVGLNFVPIVGPYLSALVGPIASLFSKTQQRSEEAARDGYRDAVYDGLAKIQAAVDRCQITPQQGQAAGRELINQMYKACDQFTKSSVAKSCRNYEVQDVPGGAQEGAFTTRLTRISQSGSSCGASSAAGLTAGSPSPGSPGSAVNLTTNLPKLLLLAGGVYLVMKMLK